MPPSITWKTKRTLRTTGSPRVFGVHHMVGKQILSVRLDFHQCSYFLAIFVWFWSFSQFWTKNSTSLLLNAGLNNTYNFGSEYSVVSLNDSVALLSLGLQQVAEAQWFCCRFQAHSRYVQHMKAAYRGQKILCR